MIIFRLLISINLLFLSLSALSVELYRPDTLLRGHREKIKHLSISPNQEYILSGSGYGNISLWDLKRSGKVFSIAADDMGKNKAAISPDNKYFIIRLQDGKIGAWDLATQTLQTYFYCAGSFEGAPQFSPDGENFWHLCRAKDDGIAWLRFNIRLGENIQERIPLYGRERQKGGAYSSLGTYFIHYRGARLEVIDARDGYIVHGDLTGERPVSGIQAVIKDDQEYLAVLSDEKVYWFNLENGIRLSKIDINKPSNSEYYNNQIGFWHAHPAGDRLVVSYSSAQADILSLDGRNKVSLSDESEGEQLHFTPQGNYVYYFGPRTIQLYDAKNGNKVPAINLSENVSKITTVAFSDDETFFVTGHANGNVQIWQRGSSGVVSQE